jgi:hypothetical protein
MEFALPRKPFFERHRVEESCKNKFGFREALTLTPALSHRMGEGESFSVGRSVQPLQKLQETDLGVPSPIGRERVRVRVILFEIHLLSGTCFCTNPKYVSG